MVAQGKIIQVADDTLKIQMLDQISLPVMAVNLEMKMIYINEAGQKFLDKTDGSIIGQDCAGIFQTGHCNTENCCVRRALNSGKSHTARTVANVRGEKIPVEYSATPLVDEEGKLIGALEYFIDISEQFQHDEQLREQNDAIRQMSTPTIKLWDGVLVLPIVGIVDSMRAQHMMETMLQKITETYAKVIILDISGVAAVDTAVANHLIKITKATHLLGCECILSGISPAVAQTIVHLGIDMYAIKTKTSLGDALNEAFGMLNMEVVKRSTSRT